MDLSVGQIVLIHRQTEVDMAEKALLDQEVQYSSTAASWLKDGHKIFNNMRASLMKMCGRDPATGLRRGSTSTDPRDVAKENRKKLAANLASIGAIRK